MIAHPELAGLDLDAAEPFAGSEPMVLRPITVCAAVDSGPLDPEALADYFRSLPRPALLACWVACITDAALGAGRLIDFPAAAMARCLLVVRERLCSLEGPDRLPPVKRKAVDSKWLPQHLTPPHRPHGSVGPVVRAALAAAIPGVGDSVALRDLYRCGGKERHQADVNVAGFAIKTGLWPEFRIECRPDPLGKNRNKLGIRYAVRVGPDPIPAP